MDNQYDSIVSDMVNGTASAVRNNVISSIGQNPDQAARHQQLAKATGLPLESVQADPLAAQQNAAMQSMDAHKLVQQYPNLAQFMTDPSFAAIAHDDIQRLAATEAAAKMLPTPRSVAPQPAPSFWDSVKDNVSSLASVPYNAAQGLGLSFNRASKSVNILAGAVPTLYDRAASLMTGRQTSSAEDWWFKNMVDPLDQSAQSLQVDTHATAVQKFSHGAGQLVGTIAQIELSGGNPNAIASELSGLASVETAGAAAKNIVENTTKTMAFPALSQAVNTGNDVYQATGSAASAVRAATAAWATTTATGLMPLSMEGGLAKRVLTGAPIGMVSGEANRQAMNWALPDNMQQQFDPTDMLISGLTGSMLAGVMGPRSPVLDAVRERAQMGEKADQSVSAMQGVQSLSELAAQSKLRERDPEAFHDFIDNIAQQHTPDLYVDGAKLAEALRQSGITPDELNAKLPDIASQMTQALEANGDVRIPVADYATRIAGTPLDQAIMPHLKTDPDGMTFEEGQQYLQNHTEDIAKQAQALTEEQATRDAHETQVEAYRKRVEDQLNATGRFSGNVSRDYSALHAAWLDTLAKRMGMTPDDVLAKLGPALEIGRTGGEGYGQKDAVSRGFYDPSSNTIALTDHADLSTFLHETGHYYLESLHRLASDPNAPQGIKDDFDTLAKWMGMQGPTAEARLLDWTSRDVAGKTIGHEQFAEAFERYLHEGKAPTPELQSLFGRFRAWLLNVYGKLTTRGAVLNDDVRGVMDRMLASQEAIETAEKARGYFAMELPEGTDPEMVAAYQREHAQATDDAIREMQERSLKDMQWIANAKQKAMKAINREAKEKRASIRDEVTKEVMDQPVYKAEKFLRSGEQAAPENESNAQRKQRESTLGINHKLDIDALKEMYGDGPAAPWRYLDTGPHGLAGKDGIHPDLVGEMFGYNSGKELVHDLLSAPDAKSAIEKETDLRMLERHGELVDPASIERAAEAAIHNEARARMMATGLKILTKSPMGERAIVKAAAEAAETYIAKQKVGTLRPAQFSAAEARSNKALIKAAPKDPAEAAKQQRAALLNNRLFKSAINAQDDVRKGLTYLKRFGKDSVRAKIDVDIRDQIDDLLSRFDLRKNPTDGPTRAQQNLAQWIDAQQRAGYEPSVHPDLLQPQLREHYKDMSVEQFRGLVDTIKSMENLGKARNDITVAGRKIALDEYVESQLIPKLQEHGQKFTADELYERAENRGISKFSQALDHVESFLRSVNAELLRPDFKTNAYDRHELFGPFAQAITEPLLNANYRKVEMLKGLSDDFRAMADKLGKDWQKSLTEKLENKILLDTQLTLESGKPVFIKMTRGRMLGIAQHVGNESNFDKLIKGYGWDGAAVWHFLHENMTAKDWQATQHVWELYEKHWPDMEAMYHRLGQTVPDKIEPRPFMTPFGEMKGGYARITYDPLRSRFATKRGADDLVSQEGPLFKSEYFDRATTTTGSMNKRNEGYTDALDLDYHTIERSLHEQIHDLAYREALINANKVIEHTDFRREFMKSYGREDYQELRVWLRRIANMNNASNDSRSLTKILNYARTGMVMTGIGMRFTTVLKHGSAAAIKTLGYMAGGGEKYFAPRFASMFMDYRNQVALAREKFPEIAARALQQDRDYRATASSMFEPESWQSKAERFGHAMVAYSDLFTAVPTAWGAYDRAVTEGVPVSQGGTGKPMSEAEAVAYAGKMVREAHGSTTEASLSNIMSAQDRAVKMFTTLYGFMNNTYGQMSDVASKLRTAGLSKPELFARALASVVIPALAAELLTKGTPDESKDESWAEWAAKAITGEVAACVPLVRDAYTMIEGYKNAGLVPVESWLHVIGQPGVDAYKAASGQHVSGAIQHAADFAGYALHIPMMGQAGKTLQYEYDIQNGNKPYPTDELEHMQGLTVGVHHH